GQVQMVMYDSDGGGSAQPYVAERFLWGPGTDEALAAESFNSSNVSQGVYWAFSDHEGSVTDVLKADGNLVQQRRYDGFGNVLATSTYNGGVPTTPLSLNDMWGYTGRQSDSATGLQYNRERWYDPSTGRFINEDPSEFSAGDSNFYRYVGNNPLVGTD